MLFKNYNCNITNWFNKLNNLYIRTGSLTEGCKQMFTGLNILHLTQRQNVLMTNEETANNL